MTSTNTITVQKPGTTREADERYAFAFIGQRQVQGGLGTAGNHMHTVNNSTQEQFVRSNYPNWDVRFADRDSGHYHPNIHMGSYEKGTPTPPLTPQQHRALIASTEREDILIDDLRKIARVVTPNVDNRNAYGSAIRNLLVAACIEVEAQCKAIFRANHLTEPTQPPFWNIWTYSKLAAPLRLAEYVSSCDRFPDYPTFKPFDGWQLNQSLPWYRAYNDSKHNVDTNAKCATLEHAITAVAAVSTLLLAQYGPRYMDEYGGVPFFGLVDTPTWEAHERNYPPPSNQLWIPVDHPF